MLTDLDREQKIKFFMEMTFLTLLLDLMPSIGYAELGGIRIASIQIPTIATGVILGPVYGMMQGMIVGITGMCRAFARDHTAFDFFFRNPAISIFPRMMAGFAAGIVYRGFKRLTNDVMMVIPVAISSFAATFTDRVLILAMLRKFCMERICKMYAETDISAASQELADYVLNRWLTEAAFCFVLAGVIIWSAYSRFTGKGGVRSIFNDFVD